MFKTLPQKTENQRYITPPSDIDIEDAFVRFANPSVNAPITLIKPPVVFSKATYSIPIVMPLGLAYIAAVMEKSGYRVNILDCPGLGIDRIQLTPDGNFNVLGMDVDESIKLIPADTDIIGITIMFSQEWPFVRDYIKKVRAAFPKATIVVGGEHVTAMAEFSLKDCPAIDYVVLGEGELTFLQLVYELRSKKPAEAIRGVAYRKGDAIVSGGQLPRLANIKKMPWPAWHLVNLEPYFRPNFTMGISQGRNIGMLATRGCPYQCTFCSNPTMWTTRYTMRDVKDVVDEMETYVRELKATSIDFYDLTAIVKKEWILDLIKELKVRGIKVVWQLPSGTRSESLDDEVLSGLKDTGCKFIVYAPESGSQRTLDMIKKRVNLDKLIDSVKIALAKKLIVKVNFIIGFPFETRMDVYKTMLFAWKLALIKTDDCNISTFAPYPGSELFQELNKEGRFGQINDAYFNGLVTQFDLTVPRSFCRYVPGWELMIYRVMGMAVFYGLSYLRCPSRILRLVKFLLSKNAQFEPNSLLEQRVFDMKARFNDKSKQSL